MKKLSNRKSKNRQKKASTGKPYVFVSYLFVGVFLSLIGYMVYFHTVSSEEFLNSPYNSRQDTFQEWVVRGEIQASDGTVLAKTEVDEEGNEKRIYPHNQVYAHVVGYMDKGKSGLESLMNYELLTSHANPVEKVTNEFQEKKNQGDNVITTLDPKLQQVAYDALGNNRGAVVVMEPDTGKVLASVSKPDFNPNTLSQQWDSLVADENNSCLVNRALQGQYPPGSTFKIVTTLAYLREHGNDISGFGFNCTGELTAGNYTLHDYNNSVHGQENLETAFAKSCNTAFAQMGMDLNRSAYKEVADDLLFNSKLPIDLPYNKSKFTLEKNDADELTMQTAIGQGNTLVTPMHMAMIVSAIANDGELMKPQFVEKIESYTGSTVKTYAPKSVDQLMTKEEAQILEGLMRGVVSEGTASALAGLGHDIVGKTGSAEHGDLSQPSHSWFVGYSNAEDPDIAVAVIAESAGTGSAVAVPVASKIFQAYYS